MSMSAWFLTCDVRASSYSLFIPSASNSRSAQARPAAAEPHLILGPERHPGGRALSLYWSMVDPVVSFCWQGGLFEIPSSSSTASTTKPVSTAGWQDFQSFCSLRESRCQAFPSC